MSEMQPPIKLERVRQRLEATDADLSESTFNDVKLSGAVFNDVNLTGATIQNANLANLRIRDADLRGASIVDSQTDGMMINGIPVADLLAAYRVARSENT